MNEINDLELMRAFCNGDCDAIGVLYQRYHRNLVHRLFAICGDLQAAEDAAQETWHTVLVQPEVYRPPRESQFGGWLYVIGYRKAVTAWRKSHREHTFSEPADHDSLMGRDLADDRNPITESIRHEREAELRMAIDQLDPHYRMTILFYYFEEYDVGTISDILEISEKTVYSRLHTARKKLLAALTETPPDLVRENHGVSGKTRSCRQEGTRR